jgi:hypothetical protein
MPMRAVRYLLIALLLACLHVPPGAAQAPADETFTPQIKPTLVISRAAGAIRIDGSLDDPGWQDAARANGFCEHSPGDQTKPPVDSEAWATYDDENFYVALIAYDDPSAVRVSLCDRDAIFQDDYFGLMFDTYGDLAWAYEMFVNPLGLQGDLRMDHSGEEDIAFDLVWDSRGRVTDRGYQVEIAIPFSSLRFPDREEQVWRFNFWRDHQRDVRRRYTWSATNRDEACWMCQWGTLRGIRGIRPRTNIDLIASAVGQLATTRTPPYDPGAHFAEQDPEGELSLNARYGLSSSSSTELAINPDFSQIESDVGQIDVNTTFALYYPERRPFFQEGSDLYQTLLDVIHTRSIVDPQVAAKLTGTFGRTSLLYLAARDGNTPILIPGEEGSYQASAQDIRSFSNILRVRRTLLEDSHVGLTLTDRRFLEGVTGSGTLLSLDSFLRFLADYNCDVQAIVTYTREPDDTLITCDNGYCPTFDEGRHTVAFDGESFAGYGLFAGVERHTRHWNTSTSYLELSPTFRADNGFITENGYRRVLFYSGLQFSPNRRWLSQWTAGFDALRFWTTTGEFKRDYISPGIQGVFPGQTSVELELTHSRESFAGQRFDNLLAGKLSMNSRPMGGLGFDVEIERSRTILRSFFNPHLANALEVSVAASIRPLSRLLLEPQAFYYRLDERHGGPNIFEGTIWRGRMSFQFSRACAARFVAQYDNVDEQLDLEPLLTYRINPFTIFYLGAASRQMKYPTGTWGDEECPFCGLAETRWKPTDRQYFAKVQYLWRM